MLLYLHGGPGAYTSDIDYAFTRKWADVFTVATLDQQNCGKSYYEKLNGTVLTRELFLEDGKSISEFLKKHLSVDKISVLGHSWGSIYDAKVPVSSLIYLKMCVLEIPL